MESSPATRGLILLFSLVLAVTLVPEIDAGKPFLAGPWKPAHATFYGGPDGSGTFEGACGYTEEQKLSYGLDTAALSSVLFRNGAGCGACFELKCVDKNPQLCSPGAPSLLITGTNLCPPGDTLCSPPNDHFDLTMPAFLRLAPQKSGIIPVNYRRVPCKRLDGIRFTISTKSNPYFLLLLVWNVGGAGDVEEVLIKGTEGMPWIPMKRNWGQCWQADRNLVGQQLNIRVKASDGRTTTSWRVTPPNWQFGQTYVGKNFLK